MLENSHMIVWRPMFGQYDGYDANMKPDLKPSATGSGAIALPPPVPLPAKMLLLPPQGSRNAHGLQNFPHQQICETAMQKYAEGHSWCRRSLGFDVSSGQT